MRTLHLVSHTHWDREWYLTFQQFRLRLVQLIDNLLELFASDPEYKHFMLDGQTIVLDDYLQIRPEREAEIRAHVASGRLLIGPWYILPDEFLVSPEATIRNLLQGDRIARRFGPKMQVGYIPDPFGHIGQMPQILRGFGIETAACMRGLADEPCELWWEAPDGSRVLAAYLRDGYYNAAQLPTSDAGQFIAEVRRLRDSLAPHTATHHILLMHGTDHMPPRPDTTSALASAQGRLDGDALIHSTLPAYLAAVQSEIAADPAGGHPHAHPHLPVVRGELRLSKRHPLLPGVLSTRMWIKQRNHACETLLEKWVEPLGAWATVEGGRWKVEGGRWKVEGVVRYAWRLLMECHPHDSICGCSIDQVHEEMRVRFDQVEQIGEELVHRHMNALAAKIDTQGADGAGAAIVVFNPVAGPRTDVVTVACQIPAGIDSLEIVDENGAILPHHATSTGGREIASLSLDREGLRSMLGMVQEGGVAGMVIRDVGFRREGERLLVDLVTADSGGPNAEVVKAGLDKVQRALADETLTTYVIRVRSAQTTTVQFVARDVPGYGYRTFWIRPAPQATTADKGQPPLSIENEFLVVEVSPEDGTLTVTDRRTGARFAGLNRFVDGGDCGDEYNYSPPPADCLVTAAVQSVHIEHNPARPAIVVSLALDVPVALGEDRRARAAETTRLRITTRAMLTPGVPRVDIATDVDNSACDHRLRVHFPAPFAVTAADYDGHFEVVRRPLLEQADWSGWVEQPRPEAPQRAFADVSDGQVGLMIANRGLPEVQVLTGDHSAPMSEIALTLLRCVGWLSRDDFPTRQGHAGPMLATPGAQMIGSHHFEYAIIPHAGDWRNAFWQAYAFDAPLRAVATDIHAGALPPTLALLHVEPSAFVISAIKPPEEGEGLIVRGYNIDAEPLHVTLKPYCRFNRAVRVRLDEKEQAELDQDGSVHLIARGHEIVTVKFQ